MGGGRGTVYKKQVRDLAVEFRTCSIWVEEEEPAKNSEKECVCTQSLHSCLTLCDPMDCSPPGFSVHGRGKNKIRVIKVLPWWLSGIETACSEGDALRVRQIPWRRKCQPTPVFLPVKSHGQRSLAA